MKRMQLYFSILLLFLSPFFLVNSIHAQSGSPDPAYRLVTGNNDFVSSKNYYLLTLFNTLPDVKKLLNSDIQLSSLARTKREVLVDALAHCDSNGHCYVGSMKFDQSEIDAVTKRLGELYQPDNALGQLVSRHLIPSGRYVLLNQKSPKDMLLSAWEQDARGINFCLDVYAGGAKPAYPLIDSISFRTKNSGDTSNYLRSFVNLLYDAISLLVNDTLNSPSFCSVPLHSALLFLEMNERLQAGDYEPMEAGENRGALDKIKKLNWNQFVYSVILVPGAGPEEPGVALSAEGMIRCRLAALNYQKGLAPFIIVSGGKVHPYKTRYCEAIEMKGYLTTKLHIPADAVIIEPHARHTTTNMRNAARLIFRYGIPFTKPGITCTTRAQSNLISTTFPDRCKRELGEVPYRNGKRLSETAAEFYPLIEALQSNPMEPMDP